MRVSDKVKQLPAAGRGEVWALWFGIVVNALLTVAKFWIGDSTHCAALVADGLKDMSEAARSGLNVGLRFLHRDLKEHAERPAHIVRIEKMVSLTVFVLIAWMGIHSVIGSVRDALEQHETHYTAALVWISLLSIAAKAYMAVHRRRLGNTLNSQRLRNESDRALTDCIFSAAILASAYVDHTFHIDIDPWIGCAIGARLVFDGIQDIRRHISARAAA